MRSMLRGETSVSQVLCIQGANHNRYIVPDTARMHFGTKGDGRIRTAKHTTSLEWPFEIAFGRLPEDMNLHGFAVIEGLQSHDSLHEERLGVFEI